MRRRARDESRADALLEVLEIAPVWVGPVLAVGAFAGLRWGMPLFLPNDDVGRQLLRGIWPTLSWVVGGVILGLWVIAEGRKFLRRRRRLKFTNT